MMSWESTAQTVLAEAPHGCSETGVRLAAVVATPTRRLLPTTATPGSFRT